LLGELDAIAHEVDDNLAQAGNVAAYHFGQVFVEPAGKF
jgi:hypothetical protein